MLRNKELSRENGFTMVEMLIVLFVIVSVTSIVHASFRTFHASRETAYELHQIVQDLYLAQETAIARGESVHFVIHRREHEYALTARDETVLFERSYDAHLEVTSNFGYTITFHGDGNIARFGTLKIAAGGNRYKIVFHIGKGRFYVEKG
ncbi:MAG TPA: competence type IV pilus minor pilin ComGD [Bacillales bacterium]|nr:competence type IV pilus minor pilin ComGD [Bacillales bacterium]